MLYLSQRIYEHVAELQEPIPLSLIVFLRLFRNDLMRIMTHFNLTSIDRLGSLLRETNLWAYHMKSQIFSYKDLTILSSGKHCTSMSSKMQTNTSPSKVLTICQVLPLSWRIHQRCSLSNGNARSDRQKESNGSTTLGKTIKAINLDKFPKAKCRGRRKRGLWLCDRRKVGGSKFDSIKTKLVKM